MPRHRPTVPISPVVSALLIGINYRRLPASYRLSGCVNDVAGMRDLLVSRFSVSPARITVMTDDARVTPDQARLYPSYVNVKRQLTTWLASLNSGDLGVLHYSGHGSQVSDRSGDEPVDRLDETIYLADRTQMTDDELNQLLGAASARGVRLRCFFDSCHSGTIVDLRQNYTASKTVELVGGARSLSGDIIVLSGSQDAGTSADTVIGGRPVGAMSAYLTQTLQTVVRTGLPASWRDVTDAVRILLAKNRYRQVPILSATSEEALSSRMTLA